MRILRSLLELISNVERDMKFSLICLRDIVLSFRR